MKQSLIAFILLILSTDLLAAERIPCLQVSELFVDLTSSEVLYAKQASLALIPASLTKLFVASSALQHWGAYHTFTTQIYRRGDYHNGILTGELVFYGLGDPEFTNESMWHLVNKLQQAGLKKINGNILVNTSYFGQVIVSATDRIQAKSQSTVSYDALLSSAGSNFGTVAVAVQPGGKIGNTATLQVLPYTLQNIVPINKVMTCPGSNNTLQLIRRSSASHEILTASGTIGNNSPPVTLYRSLGNPNVATGALLQAFLQQAGILSHGQIIIESTPLYQTDTLLAELAGRPLVYILQDLLRYSNNYIADVLTLALWRTNQPTSRLSIRLSDATQILFKTDGASTAKKGALHAPLLNSGSGLTSSNRLSAEHLVSLLKKEYQNKRDFPIFYGSLVIPGQQVYWHTIPTAAHPWMSQVNVKTGHHNGVDAIAGYFRMNNGHLGAFAVLFNYPHSMETKKGQCFKVLIKHLDRIFHNKL